MPTRFLAVCVCLLVGAAFVGFLGSAFATRERATRTLYVSVTGSDDGGGTKTHPFRSIQAALGKAEPGDTVRVAAGDYGEHIVTVRSGRPGAPITLAGSRGARISGDGSGRLIQIRNDYITLRDFTIADANYVRIEHNWLENAGGECVRIKYLSTNVLVYDNTIDHCGLTGFDLERNEHNGEGVYIGTDPGQLDRNPSTVRDASDNNLIIENTIATYAAECVDIKEAAEHNRVIGNYCSHSRDPNGSGLDARGSHNLFRGNVVSATEGAGIRFGGDGAQDGIDNAAVDNVLVANRGYGLLVLRQPQARICGNVIRQSGLGIVNVRGASPSAPC
jgi:hypothetical protein